MTKCSGKPVSQHWVPVDGTLTIENVNERLQTAVCAILANVAIPGWDCNRDTEILRNSVYKAIGELGYNYYPDGSYPLDVDMPWDGTLSYDPNINNNFFTDEDENLKYFVYDEHADHKHFVCIEFPPSKSIPDGIV